jgi:hypothetical protein
MAAVVWSAMPWLTAPQLRRRLEDYAHPTNQPYTGSGLVTSGFFPIVLQKSGKCLDHQGGTTDRGKVRLWECHGGPENLWTYDPSKKLIVSSFGWCLNADPVNGGSVYISRCDPNSANQRWDRDTVENTFKFRGNEAYCLDAHKPDTFYNGATVQIYRCGGASNQQWLFQRFPMEKVQLCRHSDCRSGGDTYRASVGHWNRMPHQIGNDGLTRVEIPPGYAFQYFEHEYFGGWNHMYGSQDVKLTLTFTGNDNDVVSSFRIRKLPEGNVKLCSHVECISGVFDAIVGEWSSMPSEIGNDQLSYVHIPQGYTFEYFEHDNFGGWSGKFGSCSDSFSLNLAMVGFDNVVSSFKIGLAC